MFLKERMKNIKCFALALILLSISQSAFAQDFGNDGVVALSQADLGDDVILAKIETLPCVYDVSTDSLIYLRRSGVSNRVIASMVERCVGSSRAQGSDVTSANPLVHRNPGIYLDRGRIGFPDLVSLRPIMASAGQVTGNGSLLFPSKTSLGLSGASSAQAVSSGRPTLYFYFENDDRRVGDFGSSATGAAQSPNEFSLVRFRVRNGQRQLNIGQGNMFNTRIGLDPEDVLGLSIEEVNDGIYRVSPSEDLTPGEYGFALKMGSDTYRIFDFRVQ